MAMVNGSQILARTLRRLRTDTFFYIMGGPMMAAESACVEEGLRAIDVRHEQAAAMMAHAASAIAATASRALALEHAVGIEHRSVHADAFHGRARRGAHLDRAARAAPHRAGHELLERYLAGHPEVPCERCGGLEHRRRPAGEDLDLGKLGRT